MREKNINAQFLQMNTPHPESAVDGQIFMDDRLGLFVHLGVYSNLGGEWKGHYQNTNPLSEHIMQVMQIPLALYREVATQFRPADTWAETLCMTAKAFGAKYIVFHAKQHDGYCAFRSTATDFNAWDIIGRDLVAEIAEACRKHGLKLGLYYSQDLDWSQEHAGGTRNAYGQPSQDDNWWDWPNRDKKDFSIYFNHIVKPHIRELLTHYGNIELLWFDYPHNISTEQCDELYKLVKNLQPHCLVNNRIGPAQADYFTLGDNEVPMVDLHQPQECLITLNHSWGYNAFDHDWKEPSQIIGILGHCLSAGVNLLTNVGPMGDGSIPMGTRHIAETLGVWYQENRDALYGTRGNPLRALPEWGYISQRGRDLFFFMKDNAFCKTEEQRTCSLNGLPCRVLEISAVADGTPIPYSQEGTALTFTVPASRYFMPVYRAVCASAIRSQTAIYQQIDGFRLHPFWASKCVDGEEQELITRYTTYDLWESQSGLSISRGGSVDGWFDASESLRWNVMFSQPGNYLAEVITREAAGVNSIGTKIFVRDSAGICSEAVTDNLREIGRTSMSKTNRQNVLVSYDASSFSVSVSGSAVVELCRRSTNQRQLPLTLLRLVRQV